MAALDLNVSSTQCRRCGKAYGRLKGYFPVSYSYLYKGTGYMPYCRSCIDEMYDAYFLACRDQKLAVRQMCRKLDLYWNESLCESTLLQSATSSSTKSIMTTYIAKLNKATYAAKSYDDTLEEEGAMWDYDNTHEDSSLLTASPDIKPAAAVPDVDQEVREFWGEDYTADFIRRLDKRYRNWTKDQGGLEPGSISLFKHICILEETIAVDSAAGRPVDKNMNTLNTLLGSLNLKPVQKKEDTVAGADTSPMGVWIRRFENERPIPKPDPELEDVDKIVHYIQVFFLGHLAKMLNKTTVYSKMYDEEIARLRVENPELSDEHEDDNEFFEERFAQTEDGEGE